MINYDHILSNLVICAGLTEVPCGISTNPAVWTGIDNECWGQQANFFCFDFTLPF